MNYENYIWDLGGTLLNNYESSSHAFAATLWQKEERVVLHDEIYAALKVSTAYAIEQYARHIPGFLAAYRRLEAEGLARPILFEGATELLKNIVTQGYKNFMISHRDKQVITILKAAHISQYFTEIVTADDGFPRKLAPNSVHYLLQKYNLNPKKTVMIGDRVLDIEAGHAAGVDTIFFDSHQECSLATKNIKKLTELME
ncbi:HAD-IA family hydrolase [Lactococcus ileimucosae]|uniref:HAD-IA family hydrolase n=1 Tax=Lactococcus ileimucosae TaxID=2941329 RepID=A0ABV4D7D7_9LACT